MTGDVTNHSDSGQPLVDEAVPGEAQASRESEVRYRAFFEAIRDGIAVADAETGVILDCNEALALLVERPRSELIGQPGRSLHPPEHLLPPGARRTFEEYRSGGQDVVLETEVITSGGERRPVEVKATRLHLHGRPVLLGSFRDISGRLDADRDVQRLAALVESSGDPMVVVDLDRVIQAWNPAAERLFGYGLPEIRRLGLAALTPPELMEEARSAVAEVLGRREHVALETVRLARDGTRIEVRMTLSPVRDRSGSIVGLSAVLRDIREQRRVHARLVRTSRLASVGSLAAGVAHEVNNPLTWTIQNLVSLDRECSRLGSHGSVDASPERLGAMVKGALDGARRVQSIASRMEALASVGDELSGPVRINRVMAAALDLTRSQLLTRARVAEDLKLVPAVSANEGQLYLVFVNLFTNAAEAIQGTRPDDEEIGLRCWSEAGEVIAQVSDSGCGIPDEQTDRIFEPFFTTRTERPGSGLGLSFCQAVVEGLGGVIEVDSQVGRGSVFRIRLPRRRHGITTEVVPVERPVEASVRRRVLVVDDERMLRATLRSVLSRSHDVVTAGSADEAQALLSEPFDAILCDLQMPGRSGMDLFDWVLAHQPGLARRMVFMTGGVFTREARRFLAARPDGWLRKPFEEGDVVLGRVLAEVRDPR